jgi:hypothetical protein
MLNNEKIIPKQCEMRLIMGDWNAQIGDFDEKRWGSVSGKFVDGESEGKINGNGRRLLNFCKREGLYVSSTYYKKDIPVEVLKSTESELLSDGVLSSFNVALRTGNVQSGWRDVIITILHKKGDPKVCD